MPLPQGGRFVLAVFSDIPVRCEALQQPLSIKEPPPPLLSLPPAAADELTPPDLSHLWSTSFLNDIPEASEGGSSRPPEGEPLSARDRAVRDAVIVTHEDGVRVISGSTVTVVTGEETVSYCEYQPRASAPGPVAAAAAAAAVGAATASGASVPAATAAAPMSPAESQRPLVTWQSVGLAVLALGAAAVAGGAAAVWALRWRRRL